MKLNTIAPAAGSKARLKDLVVVSEVASAKLLVKDTKVKKLVQVAIIR